MSAARFIVPEGYTARPEALNELAQAQAAMRANPALDLVAALKLQGGLSLLPTGCTAPADQVALDLAAKALMRADSSLSYIAAVKKAQQAQAQAAAQAQRHAAALPPASAPAPRPALNAPKAVPAGAGTAQPQLTALDLWLSLKDVELHASRVAGAGENSLAREAAHLSAMLRAALTLPGQATVAPARAAAISEASAWLARHEPRIAALRTQSLQAADATARAAFRAHQQQSAGGVA